MAVTRFCIGPKDHGRVVTDEEFEHGEFRRSHRYELIDGRVYVSPLANMPHDGFAEWPAEYLRAYTWNRPDVINYVRSRARVFVPGAERSTRPEPDLAAYRDFPLERLVWDYNWQEFSPQLVVEIVSEGGEEKDLRRNLRLYRQVPTIQEYGVVEPGTGPETFRFRAYRRLDDSRWRRLFRRYGGTYATPLLPDFDLPIDPHRRPSRGE